MRNRGKGRTKVSSETTKSATTAKNGIDDQRTSETTTTATPTSQSPSSTTASVDLVLPLLSANQAPNHNGDQQETEAIKTTIVTLEGERLFRYVVNLTCRELHPNMGFHPFMFRDNGKCSLRQSWGTCWKEECINLLEEEWGCALGQDDPSPSSSSSCITPYHKSLHQVRNPLKTVESLVTKFCIGGVDGELQPSFAIFAKALFPQHDFSSLSCIEASGCYVYEYSTAILGATQRGYIDAAFQVEEGTPCKIAKLAGFLGDDDNEITNDNITKRHTNNESGTTSWISVATILLARTLLMLILSKPTNRWCRPKINTTRANCPWTGTI